MKKISGYVLAMILTASAVLKMCIRDSVEVIVRQMLKKIRIESSGDTEYLPGTLVDVLDFEEINENLTEQDKAPAEGTQICLLYTSRCV